MGNAVRDTGSSNRIMQARLIAGELWDLMRADAVHRLGLAGAYPNAVDRAWSPEFYRRCHLAERLFAILDDVSSQSTAVADDVNREAPPGSGQKAAPRVVAHPVHASRRRLGV